MYKISLLATLVFSFPAKSGTVVSGGNSGLSTTTIDTGNGSVVPQIDSSLLSAIQGEGSCKGNDYIIESCGVQQSTLKQGVVFCFNKREYLLLCNEVKPYCVSPGFGSILGKDINTMCSVTPPYYGALTVSF